MGGEGGLTLSYFELQLQESNSKGGKSSVRVFFSPEVEGVLIIIIIYKLIIRHKILSVETVLSTYTHTHTHTHTHTQM